MWAERAQVCGCVLHVPNFSACLKSLSASIMVVASSSARSTYAAAHLNKFKCELKAETAAFFPDSYFTIIIPIVWCLPL